MDKITHCLFKTKLICYSFILFLSLYSTVNFAQCAGNDATLTVCDNTNPANLAISLFPLLGGTAVVGGTWTDDMLSGGFNTTTGVLNAQQIIQSGIYTYTYTVTGVLGCVDNSSTVTVTIGGYAGVAGPNVSVCSDSGSFNLFQVFNGSTNSPQSNGTWYNNTNSTPVTGSSISIAALGVGTFQFTYTVAAIGTCPPSNAVVFVTIYKSPVAGTATNLVLCEDNLSTYTNVDLNTYLTGQDAGGRWSETIVTSEITTAFDHNVNVQNIYNTLGAGTYGFTYTVSPLNPICSSKAITVNIIIEKKLNLTGGTFNINSDICESQIATATYTGTITQGTQPIPKGQYSVTYQVVGPTSTVSNTILANFNNGVMTFPMSSVSFQQVGVFTVNITNISILGNLGSCTNIINLSDTLTISPTPMINNATLTIDPVCQGFSPLVQMSTLSNIADGNYQLTYNLSGSNSANNQNATIVVTGGVANFSIPATLVPNSGTTTISIVNIVNLISGCSNTTTLIKPFEIKPLPIASTLFVAVSNVCKNEPVTVALSGLGVLANVTISYILSGANTTVTTQTITLAPISGTATFVIPQTLLPNTGLSTISITNLSNTGNSCGVIPNNVNGAFTISPLPTAPVANNINFCKLDNATIASLLPSGTQYQWFNSPTAITALTSTTLLVSGNYYVQQTSAITGCKSPRTMISVIINELQTPTLNANGQNFCGLDNPTLQQLSNNTASTGTLVWYNAATGGTQLSNATLLTQGTTYYGFNFSSVTSCYSTTGLPVTISLTDCNTVPGVGNPYDFFVPDGFSPNGDGINDVFEIPKIQFLYPNYTLEVYNRYGSLLFSGDVNKPSWDGKNSESTNLLDGIAPNGIYFYIINFNKDDKSPEQGRLYLNR